MYRMKPVAQARFGYPHMRARAEEWIGSVLDKYLIRDFYVKINGSEFLARNADPNNNFWFWVEEPFWFEYETLDMEIIPLSDMDPDLVGEEFE